MKADVHTRVHPTSQPVDNGSDVRRGGAPPGAALSASALAQRRWRLDDGIETPSHDAVDEEAEEKTLVDESRAGLHCGSGQKEERENVVVNAETEARQKKEDQQTRDEKGVEFQVGGKLARDADVVDLRDDDADDGQEDDGEGDGGAGLGFDVVRSETLDGDEGTQGVVVEGADEAEGKIEDGFFDLGG